VFQIDKITSSQHDLHPIIQLSPNIRYEILFDDQETPKVSSSILDDLTRSQLQTYKRLEEICLGFLQHKSIWSGPRCILLHGSEGSGKSHILSRLSSQVEATNKSAVVIKLSANRYQDRRTRERSHDINSSEYDRFISILSETIDSFQAKVAQADWRSLSSSSEPVIIFVDDLDTIYLQYFRAADIQSAIEPLTSRAGWLLHELTMSSRHQPVFIVAATELAFNQLPPSNLAYPSFETSVSIVTPSYEDRKTIIRSLISSTFTKGVALEDIDDGGDAMETWSSKLSSLTASYHVGDLQILVQRAWYYFCGIMTSLPAHEINIFCWQYILKSLTMTLPKQLQILNQKLSFAQVSSYASSNHQLSWSDFCGYDEIKVKLQRLLHRFQHAHQNLGGIVLCGESGTGKSYLASIIAAETKMNFVSVQATDILSKYYSESEARIRLLFGSARDATPCVLFIDEFDAIAHKRSTEEESSGLNSRILSTFLNELDGISSSTAIAAQKQPAMGKQLLVIVSCQDISRLDDALVRTGRLQHHFRLLLPTSSDISAMLRHRLIFKDDAGEKLYQEDKRIPCADDVSVDKVLDMISSISFKLTGASIKSFINGVIRDAVREHIEQHDTEIQPCIYWKHFESYYNHRMRLDKLSSK
jgi:SpoVK/Ycf46/Vps4 family AAA+-type ATPase